MHGPTVWVRPPGGPLPWPRGSRMVIGPAVAACFRVPGAAAFLRYPDKSRGSGEPPPVAVLGLGCEESPNRTGGSGRPTREDAWCALPSSDASESSRHSARGWTRHWPDGPRSWCARASRVSARPGSPRSWPSSPGKRGAGVAWGTGIDTVGAPPFWPWIEVLRTISGWCDVAALAAAARPRHGPRAVGAGSVRRAPRAPDQSRAGGPVPAVRRGLPAAARRDRGPATGGDRRRRALGGPALDPADPPPRADQAC